VFTPLSLCWQLLNQFLLSPWGLIVPMTLLIALAAIHQLQQTPTRLAQFYSAQLETCGTAELPQLLEVLVQIGEPGIPGLVKGLASHRESVFTASRNILQHQLDQWQESDKREHHYLLLSDALLQSCGEFSPAAQAEAIRFVDQMMQIRTDDASPEAAADYQKTLAHCEQILSRLESMRRRRIEPQHSDFEPQANTIASLNRRTKQPVLLASNGQPFVPTSVRNNSDTDTNRLEIASFNALAVPRADRLQAYQQSLQNRSLEDGTHPRLSDERDPLNIASFSPVQSLTADAENKVAQQFSANGSDPERSPGRDVDIAAEYRSTKLSESGGTFDSDNFLTPELLNVPLDRVPQLPTTQLMRLLHHPDTAYIDSARKTLIGRDGFQESHLQLAWRLYHPLPAIRQEIVDMLPNTPNVQPSVWLTVLLNDPNNDVRYRTASFLATASDPTMQRLLIDKGKRDNDARIVNLAERLNESQRCLR